MCTMRGTMQLITWPTKAMSLI
ncbi:hypothetical protein LINPERPRIM_LOCUS19424 [Linum perenne]